MSTGDKKSEWIGVKGITFLAGPTPAGADESWRDQPVFDAIWAKFADKSIQAVKMNNGAVVNRGLLTYYGQMPNNGPSAAMLARLVVEGEPGNYQETQTASRFLECWMYEESDFRKVLLKSTDGDCNAWAYFTIDVLGAQGLQATLGHLSPSGIFKVSSSQKKCSNSRLFRDLRHGNARFLRSEYANLLQEFFDAFPINP